jgi:hypothetical protein
MASLRAVMAELGMWGTSTRNFCGMGIKDPKGKQWSTYVQARKIAQSTHKKKCLYPIGDGGNQIKSQGLSPPLPPPKKGGARWESNPRGYEQEIGPAQQRTGKHKAIKLRL